MGATIKDIARRLNISTSTVSYALNGGPRNVPEQVKANVLRVAKELNYRPNRIARSLVTRRSNTIGVLPTEATENLALSPYFQQCLNGILNEAERHRHDVLIYGRVNAAADNEQEAVSTLSDGRTDGVLIMAPVVDAPFLEGLRERGVPFCVINAWVPGGVCFNVNNFIGVRQGVEHLISLGHRKIAHLAGRQSLHDGRERKEAFAQVMSDHGLEIRPEWVIETDFTPKSGHEKALELFKSGELPTAVHCANDELAQGLYRAAWELDIKIPSDISVVGFDNTPPTVHMLPALTTVGQPIDRMAAEAVRALIAMAEGEVAESRTFDTDLVIRGSTAAIVA
jgi:DNA-binding LacI/PurR family transcriptional regulator